MISNQSQHNAGSVLGTVDICGFDIAGVVKHTFRLIGAAGDQAGVSGVGLIAMQFGAKGLSIARARVTLECIDV
jgi:hypothetical protein